MKILEDEAGGGVPGDVKDGADLPGDVEDEGDHQEGEHDAAEKHLPGEEDEEAGH